MSWNRWPVRSLYSAIMPSSKSRPTLSIECRKARWNAITSVASRWAIPRASASLRRKSIARGRSTSFGQRVTQVSHPTHSQSVRARRIGSSCCGSSSWSMRRIRDGVWSISLATGQPALHLPHW